MKKYPLTPVELESWLKSKTKDEVVGNTIDGCSCPIFNALKAKGTKVLSVSTFATDLDTDIVTNPKWVYTFIKQIDRLPQSQITSSQALDILNNFYICTVCNLYNPKGTNCGKKDNCPW